MLPSVLAEVNSNGCTSADAFHARALRAYIERFNFVGDPLDVAVRKLLMDVGLPRETQQIDRVIEAFAARYVQCNPNLFSSDGELSGTCSRSLTDCLPNRSSLYSSIQPYNVAHGRVQ